MRDRHGTAGGGTQAAREREREEREREREERYRQTGRSAFSFPLSKFCPGD